jgi:UDP-2,4-diacetamido-2,4,6-trideoxy-beta-L-altropyranose hydrolase
MRHELMLVRADASSTIGMGHVMRCLALAQQWLERGRAAMFMMATGARSLASRLAAEKIELVESTATSGTPEDIEATLRLASERRAFVVLDGYAFDELFQRELVRARVPCVAVDDHARLSRYEADLVVDPNVTAEAAAYVGHARGRVLCGLRYALVRRELREVPRRARDASPARRLLISFGGADPLALTEMAVSAADGFDTTVLVGSTNPRRDAILRAADRLHVRAVLDAPNVALHMAEADLALTAAGTTCSELAYAGLPATVVVSADNQRPVALGFERLGTVRVLESTDLTPDRIRNELRTLAGDAARLRAMSDAGRAAVDGQGSARIVDALMEVVS